MGATGETSETDKLPVDITDRKAWRAALATPHPVLVHLNADTTWLIQLPFPEGTAQPPGRSRFNLLIDPWLQGPQSDVASWFSTQWHVVEPSVATMTELNSVLRELEVFGDASVTAESNGVKSGRIGDDAATFIDAVAISHEFTDHCHRATLEELPKTTPVFATDEAAKLIRSWDYFVNVVTTPPFSAASSTDWRAALGDCQPLLPPWLAIGRVVTAGNSLYYHSALVIAFKHGSGPDRPSSGQAILYSPHGIAAEDLTCVPASGLETLALLHGLHDVRIWMTKQLNLGALNGIQAARASGARYWIATHDEVKRGVGFISWLLQRTVYSLKQAVEAEKVKLEKEGEDFEFVELGAGAALVLE